MSVILQHYYLAQCSLCPWESSEQRMTESGAEKDWIAHHNAEHAHQPIEPEKP